MSSSVNRGSLPAISSTGVVRALDIPPPGHHRTAIPSASLGLPRLAPAVTVGRHEAPHRRRCIIGCWHRRRNGSRGKDRQLERAVQRSPRGRWAASSWGSSPELIPVAEGRIGPQVLDHPGPRPRARPQAVDQDHGNLTPPVGAQEREPRRLEPQEAHDVRFRPWRREAPRLPRWFVARRNLGQGPCCRDNGPDSDQRPDDTHSLILRRSWIISNQRGKANGLTG